MSLPELRPAAIFLAAVVSLSPGCGPSGPATYPATGKVIFRDGRPLPAGVIEFASVDGGPSARARIEPDGRFTLATGDRPGAVAGRHRVAVVQMAVADGAPMSHARLKHRGLSVPPKYARFETSGLERTVE